MAETLIMQSLDTDNRVTVKFVDSTLPKYGRHGELFVVNGVLYIYADFDNSNHGRWFPLTNEKEIFVYNQETPQTVWSIPVDFQTDNVQVVVYGDDELLYPDNYSFDVDDGTLEIMFEDQLSGKAHIIVNKAYDWVDRRFVVADRNFAITSEDLNPNAYYIELDTEYVEILKNGNTTFKSDVAINGSLNISSITNVNDLILGASTIIQGDLEVTGNTLIDGNTTIVGDLTVQGTTTTVNTNTISLADNIITLNSDQVGVPSLDASLNVNRGDEGTLSIISFDEFNDFVTLPIKQTDGTFVHDEVAGKTYVENELTTERTRAETAEAGLTTAVSNNYDELVDKIFNEAVRAKNAETSLTNNINSEMTRATWVEGLLRTDVDLKAPQETTYTKIETDDLIEAATTPEETLNAIKQVHGEGSGLDADTLDGLNSSDYNQSHGLTETINTVGPDIISKLTLDDGVVTSYEKRELTLADLGYTEEQAIETITGLRELLNAMTSRIEHLEDLVINQYDRSQ